jgi:DNA repair protein RadD
VSFGVNQAHALHIAEQFRLAGVECAYVDAETSDDERDRVWRDLDFGRLPVVSSVGIISYGWDHPIVSCCILGRPTESLQLHLQQIGRGGRPAAGKRDLRVLDHAGNTHRHGFYEDAREWTLDGLTVRPPVIGDLVISITTCKKCLGVFRANVDTCPYCGAPVKKQVRRITVEPGQLEEMQRAAKARAIENWRGRATDDEKRRRYEEWQAIAQANGYSPKWASVRHLKVFGAWPRFGARQGVVDVTKR